MASSYHQEARIENTCTITEERVNVTDSPSPSPAATVGDDGSPTESTDSHTEVKEIFYASSIGLQKRAIIQ